MIANEDEASEAVMTTARRLHVQLCSWEQGVHQRRDEGDRAAVYVDVVSTETRCVQLSASPADVGTCASAVARLRQRRSTHSSRSRCRRPVIVETRNRKHRRAAAKPPASAKPPNAVNSRQRGREG